MHKKQAANTPTGEPASPALDDDASAQTRLAASLNEPVGPEDITAPPQIILNPAAVSLYEVIGEEDGQNAGADENFGPRRPEQPSAEAVRNSSRSVFDRLGERWERVKAHNETGRLGRVTPHEIRFFREVAKHTWHLWLVLGAVLGAGVTAELVYGYRAAALLTLAVPVVALLGAIAFSLAMNGLSWYAAELLYSSNQNVVRGNGGRFAIAAAILIAVLVSILGLVAGGFDPIQMSTVDGGGSATAETAGPHARWTLAIAYALILTVVSTAIAAGHLLIIDISTDIKIKLPMNAERQAERDSLNADEQTALVISLGESTIEAISAAHHVGRHYVEVYNASFRRHAPNVIGEMFLDIQYDDSDPDWLPGLLNYLDTQRNRGTTRKASVTRIA